MLPCQFSRTDNYIYYMRSQTEKNDETAQVEVEDKNPIEND
jgi:hypothetical protein